MGDDGGWRTAANVPFSATSPTVTADTSSRSGYAVFSFTGPGTLEVSGGPPVTAEYLVLGGGAAGGWGGGGAGGHRTGNIELTPGTYQILVGAGSAGGLGFASQSPPGSPSILFTQA